MSLEQLKIVFRQSTLGAEFALDSIRTVLAKRGKPLTGFQLFGKPLSFSQLLPELDRTKRKGFDLEGQGFEFFLGTPWNVHLDFLLIKAVTASSITWDEWALQFIVCPDFVMAWVADSEYDFWQNAEDPLQYTAMDKSYAHLPMKSNGLPHPLEQKIIDTSGNPGRWAFRDGYIEAVGAVMWLGDSFWPLTGADKGRVVNARRLHVSNPTPTVTRVQAAEHCFTAAEGASGELQSELRSLLFPEQVAPLVTTS